MKETHRKKGDVTQSDLVMSILDAITHFSQMAQSNSDVKMDRFIALLSQLKEIKQEKKKERLELVKTILICVHQYFQDVYAKREGELHNQPFQQEMEMMMHLGESVAQIVGINKPNIKEYATLKSYYEKFILPSFKKDLFRGLKLEKQVESIDQKKMIKDIEMIKEDKKYELFYLYKEDGTPFFDKNILRHLKWISDFDPMAKDMSEDDPLLKISTLFDHEAQEVAKEIYKSVEGPLKDFYAIAFSHKDIPLVSSMLTTTMSLMLACNSHNRVENVTGKVCTHYFKDFHQFLRKFLQSSNYQMLIQSSVEERSPLNLALIELAHALAFAFFTHSGKKQDFLSYFNHLVSQALNKHFTEKKERLPIDDWINTAFEIHDFLNRHLEKFPNGPLFKALDILQESSKREGFDPIDQGNFPHYLYSFSTQTFKTSCLRMPCPTSHTEINQAKVVDEFKGFLRFFEGKKNQRSHLHFNLQDRTSLEAKARCESLEKLQKEAEFSKQFVLVTLPKGNDFYFQSQSDIDMDQSIDFFNCLEKEMQQQATSTFFFSKQIKEETLLKFIKKIIPIIHNYFFEKKIKLSHQERLNFIEIFYLFLALSIIDMIQPFTFTFSCKDAIDTGGTSSAAFFIFLQILANNQKWNLDTQQHLLWILYGPALMIRERLVDKDTLVRVLSALNVFNATFKKKGTQILKELQPLFSPGLFEAIQVG